MGGQSPQSTTQHKRENDVWGMGQELGLETVAQPPLYGAISSKHHRCFLGKKENRGEIRDTRNTKSGTTCVDDMRGSARDGHATFRAKLGRAFTAPKWFSGVDPSNWPPGSGFRSDSL